MEQLPASLWGSVVARVGALATRFTSFRISAVRCTLVGNGDRVAVLAFHAAEELLLESVTLQATLSTVGAYSVDGSASAISANARRLNLSHVTLDAEQSAVTASSSLGGAAAVGFARAGYFWATDLRANVRDCNVTAASGGASGSAAAVGLAQTGDYSITIVSSSFTAQRSTINATSTRESASCGIATEAPTTVSSSTFAATEGATVLAAGFAAACVGVVVEHDPFSLRNVTFRTDEATVSASATYAAAAVAVVGMKTEFESTLEGVTARTVRSDLEAAADFVASAVGVSVLSGGDTPFLQQLELDSSAKQRNSACQAASLCGVVRRRRRPRSHLLQSVRAKDVQLVL